MHKIRAANKGAKALGEDRRDDMRFALRAKLASKDYVDRSMKDFHYVKEKQARPDGSNPVTQIAAAQHLLYLQQKQAAQAEEQQLAELAQLQAEQQRMMAEQDYEDDYY